MFGEEEIDAIILGLRFVAQRGDEDLERAAENALAKIEAALPPEMENAAVESALLAGPVKSGKPAQLKHIREAIGREEKLYIAYTDKKGKATERLVWPIAIGFFEAAEVLAAWCETRRDFRHFRLDRIKSVTPVHERTPRRHRILLAEWRLSQDLDGMM
jgi:predicted DNA-binding transcriptional regulator YafY